MTKYIVLRDKSYLDGRWVDLDREPKEPPTPVEGRIFGSVTFEPTGEWETRDDGEKQKSTEEWLRTLRYIV